MDTTTAVTTLALVNGAIDAARKAVGLAQSLNNNDLKLQVGDVLDSILDLKLRVLDLDEERRTLKADLQKENDKYERQIAELQEQLRFKGTVYRHAGHTFVEGDDEEICSRCAEVDRRSVHLMTMNLNGKGLRPTCPECKTARHGLNPAKRSQLPPA